MPRNERNLLVTRRRLLGFGAAGASSLLLAGCNDTISENPKVLKVINKASDLTYRAQRLLIPRDALAPEYSKSEIAEHFRPNGSTNPSDPTYRALAKNGFADWRLQVDGLVEKPLQLSLADLRALPAKTQIARHDCVEGWSCIGQWTGPTLSEVLKLSGMKPNAKYVLFHCADKFSANGNEDDYQPDDPNSVITNGTSYYETIDLVDAFHPQTLLAYELNGQTLPVANGAPLRLRLGRQLGYKQAKYLMRIEVVESFAKFGSGNGGYWEDQGYQWYGGI